MEWCKGLVLPKDPDSTLDFRWGFEDWLVGGDTIDSFTVHPDPGITEAASVDDGTGVTVWLSGGTNGTTYNVTVRVVTVGGRTVDRSVGFKVDDL